MACTSTWIGTLSEVSEDEKLFIFNKLKGSVDATGKLVEEVKLLDYEKIMIYIQRDFLDKECNIEFPLELLTVLIENSVHSIYMDVMRIIQENVLEQELANNIMLILNNHVKHLFIHQNIKELITLYSAWQSYDLEMFSTALSESFESYNEKLIYKKMLMTQIVPYVFNVKDHWDKTELIAIDLALTLTSIKSIVTLNTEESGAFLNNLNRYLVITQELRDSSFDSWPKLWMIMVKLLDTRLHTTPNLLKKMLKIIEESFKAEDIKQRIRAFDCWKELIENFSLDKAYFIHVKRVNLVLTPLTSKLGKSEVLTIKRFEVFKHLLMRLQDQSVLVLKEFFIFCFGEVGETTCDPKYCHAKEVPKLDIGCAKVLLAILGHSHNNVGYCLETSTEIQLEPGLLESRNITHLYPVLINSVVECCKLLQRALRKITRNRVLHCLWNSLIKVLLQDDNKLGYVGDLIGHILNNLIMHDDQNCRNLSAILFKAIVSYADLPKVTHIVLNQITVLVKVIFTVPLSRNSIVEIGRLIEIMNRVTCATVSPTLFKEIYECFNKFKTVHVNTDFVARLWVLLAEHLNDYAEGDSLNYLVWPVLYLNHITFTEITKMILKQYEHKLVPSVEKSDPLHLKLFQYFKTCSMNDVAQLKRILLIITWFNPKITNKEILDITLEIIHSILLTTNTAENAQSVESYIRKLYKSYVRVVQDACTMQKLYSCIKDLLKFKYFGILSDAETLLKTSPDAIKLVHNKFLTIDFLTNISLDKETKLEIGEQISRLIDLFQDAKGTKTQKFVKRVLPSGGRSARIAALVTDTSASCSTHDKPVNETPVPEFKLKITKNTDEHNTTELKDKIKSTQIRKVRSASLSTSPRILRSRRKSLQFSTELTQCASDKKIETVDLANVEHKDDDDDDEIIESSQDPDINISHKLVFSKELHIKDNIMAKDNTMPKKRERPPKRRSVSIKSMTDEGIVDIVTQSEPEDTQTTESQEKNDAPQNAKESLLVIDKAVKEAPLKSPRKSPRKDEAKAKTVAKRRIFNQGSSQISLSGRPDPIMSPSSRTQKLMSKIKLLPLPAEIIAGVAQQGQETVLTFNRVVPSPLAVPKSSILKRKSAHSPGNRSSVAKRRRVSFNDPCITKKVFIRDQLETSENLETVEEDVNNQLLEDSRANRTEKTQTETVQVDTRPNVQVTNPPTYCHDVPIYPQLKDCNENLGVITKHLTGTLTPEQVLCTLSSNNIHTVGDLAMQSELNISRLHFIVSNVYNTLDDYYRRNFESKEAINEEQEVVSEQVNELPGLDKDVEIEEEIIRVLEKAISKGLSIEKLVKNCVKKCCPEATTLVQEFDIATTHLQSKSKERRLNLIKKGSMEELRSAMWHNSHNRVYNRNTFLKTCIFPYIKPTELTRSFNNLTTAQVKKVILERRDDGDYGVVLSEILANCTEQCKISVLANYSVAQLTNNIIERATPNEIINAISEMYLKSDPSQERIANMVRLVTERLVAELPANKIFELLLTTLNKLL